MNIYYFLYVNMYICKKMKYLMLNFKFMTMIIVKIVNIILLNDYKQNKKNLYLWMIMMKKKQFIYNKVII